MCQVIGSLDILDAFGLLVSRDVALKRVEEVLQPIAAFGADGVMASADAVLG